jgi:hypothetical protein
MKTKLELKICSKLSRLTTLVLLIVITTSVPKLLCAQIKLTYSVGGIGNFSTKSRSTSTYSNPLLLTGTQCYTVSNGLVKFMPVNNGQFFTTCEVNLDYIKLNISIYPNPASSYTVVKFLNQLQLEDKFRIQIFSSIGDLVDGMDVSQKQLLSGYRLPLDKLNAGLYYIQISSDKVLQTYKIFKI